MTFINDSKISINFHFNVHNLALMAVLEAATQGAAGMQAAMFTALNRYEKTKSYADYTLEEVLYTTQQFDGLSDNTPNKENLIAEIATQQGQNYEAYVNAVSIAEYILIGNLSDNTNGANFFHARWDTSSQGIIAAENGVLTAAISDVRGSYYDHLFYTIDHIRVDPNDLWNSSEPPLFFDALLDGYYPSIFDVCRIEDGMVIHDDDTQVDPAQSGNASDDANSSGFWEKIFNPLFEWINSGEENFSNAEFSASHQLYNQQNLTWFAISIFESDEGNYYGISYGYGEGVTITAGNQIVVALSSTVEVTTSQGDDVIVLAEHGADIFGASGNDTVSFVLLDTGVSASLDDNEARDISGSGPITELSSIENLTGTNYVDFLEGDSNDNILIGHGGDDRLEGQDGEDTLRGGDGDDKLYGQNDDDKLYGDDGEDELRGGGGDDKLYGGDDNDKLYGASGNDDLFGQEGDDTLYGEGGNDNIVGGDGEDYIDGGNGDDWVAAGNDNDEVYGDDGNDTLNGGNGNDEIHGDDGDDLIKGNDDNDTLYGGKDNDTLYGGDGDDNIWGGTGDDILDGGTGLNKLKGGDGDDTLIVTYSDVGSYYSDTDGNNDHLNFENLTHGIIAVRPEDTNYSRSIVIDGIERARFGNDFELYTFTNYDDTIFGYNHAEIYYMGDGNDVVNGQDGDDIIYGGNGNDIINGHDDNDTIFGGDGDDDIDGGRGNDIIYGGSGTNKIDADWGDDLIIVGDGNNQIIGRSGFDTVDYSNAKNSIYGDGDGMRVSFYHENGEWKNWRDDYKWEDIEAIIGSDFDDTIELTYSLVKVEGGDGNDTITSLGNASTIYGDDGNDIITGAGNDDELFGGNGDDIINGLGGNNLLSGGAGSDVFVFDDLEGQNTITDFEHNIDKIDLTAFSNNSIMWSFTSGDFGTMRYNCFSEKEYGTLKFHTLQTGDNVTIYTNMSTNPYVILEGISEEDLSYDDFIF